MKNSPMTGYWQYRYDEARRVILRYPVKLMQEYRRFTLCAENCELNVAYIKRNVTIHGVTYECKTSSELSLLIEKGITYNPVSWAKLWVY